MVTKSRESQLVETFVTLADTLVADYDEAHLLQILVEKCAALTDATAADVILSVGEGSVKIIAATDERSRRVEIEQVQAGTGPCLDSVTSGQVVTIPDITVLGGKWTRFQNSALEQGFLSVHAVPLRLRDTTIGSLNLFWDYVGPVSDVDTLAAQALADVATIGIVHERAIRKSDVARQQLHHALTSRVLIEQAKGAVAYINDVHISDAFTLIRDYARSNGLALGAVAELIVNRALKI